MMATPLRPRPLTLDPPLRNRAIHRLVDDQGASPEPAVYYIADREAGGLLVNAPPYSPEQFEALAAVTPPQYLFLPSHLGTRDIAAWREAGVQVIANGLEAARIPGGVDIDLDRKTRLSRTIDFLPMSGRTPGSCALRLRNKPAVVFFGPILEPGADGWPTLVLHDDDASSENRLFGVLGLQDIRYEYAFTDVFGPDTRYGPGASDAIQNALAAVLD
ncbi:MAG: hypothetical protein ACQERR_05655 [Pseudomonadota bacterium]